MKKKCSLLMTAAVLICAAMTFTGCGKLVLQSGQVYQNQEDSNYWCFHSDGKLYKGHARTGVLKTSSQGYEIDFKQKWIFMDGAYYDFELEKSCLTIQTRDEPYKLVLVAWPTEDEMKKALLPES